MRFLIVLIVIIVAWYYLMPEPEPIPVEDTYIGDAIQVREDMKDFSDEFQKADEARQRALEREIEEQTGGG